MPEKLILEILKTLIPLQEVNPLLSKIVKASLEVSKADRCLILKYELDKKNWKAISKYPEMEMLQNPFEKIDINIKEMSEPILWDPKEKNSTHSFKLPYPFCAFPLYLPSLQDFYGLLYIDKYKTKQSFTKKDTKELISFANLASLCLENDTLFEKSSIDELTKAYTKSFFLTRLEEEFQRAVRTKNSFGLFMCDVDDFKEINDTYGHLKGDLILKNFVGNIKKQLRVYDVIGRFGGDEFMILLPGLDSSNLYNVAKKMQDVLASENFEIEKPVTFSFGAVSFPFHSAKDIQELVFQADMALYQAKQQGKGRVIVLGRQTPIVSPYVSQIPKYATSKVEVSEFFQMKDTIFQLMKYIEEISIEKRELIYSKLNKLKTFLENNFSI